MMMMMMSMIMTSATENWGDHQNKQQRKPTVPRLVAGSLRVGEAARTVIDNFRVPLGVLRLTVLPIVVSLYVMSRVQ